MLSLISAPTACAGADEAGASICCLNEESFPKMAVTLLITTLTQCSFMMSSDTSLSKDASARIWVCCAPSARPVYAERATAARARFRDYKPHDDYIEHDDASFRASSAPTHDITRDFAPIAKAITPHYICASFSAAMPCRRKSIDISARHIRTLAQIADERDARRHFGRRRRHTTTTPTLFCTSLPCHADASALHRLWRHTPPP